MDDEAKARAKQLRKERKEAAAAAALAAGLPVPAKVSRPAKKGASDRPCPRLTSQAPSTSTPSAASRPTRAPARAR